MLPAGAESLELDVPIADSHTEDQTAMRENIDGCKLFGDVERFVEGKQHDAGIQPRTADFSRESGQQRQLLQCLIAVGRVV